MQNRRREIEGWLEPSDGGGGLMFQLLRWYLSGGILRDEGSIVINNYSKEKKWKNNFGSERAVWGSVALRIQNVFST